MQFKKWVKNLESAHKTGVYEFIMPLTGLLCLLAIGLAADVGWALYYKCALPVAVYPFNQGPDFYKSYSLYFPWPVIIVFVAALALCAYFNTWHQFAQDEIGRERIRDKTYDGNGTVVGRKRHRRIL